MNIAIQQVFFQLEYWLNSTARVQLIDIPELRQTYGTFQAQNFSIKKKKYILLKLHLSNKIKQNYLKSFYRVKVYKFEQHNKVTLLMPN